MVVLGYLALGVLVASLAARQGRSFFNWLLLSVLMTPVVGAMALYFEGKPVSAEESAVLEGCIEVFNLMYDPSLHSTPFLVSVHNRVKAGDAIDSVVLRSAISEIEKIDTERDCLVKARFVND
ncbi:hypothetical protein A6E01_20005 (plasmid) [Vibrio breoganii]|uniref:Uncharacterized protein n=1 Tax=Vibrio breoganii TaxID=553239 RepID=A0AAN0XZZ9_9VIBR|nr:hypothetical protein [Vibrio breoganii]ANO35499.1 hypothetical protein A6E01_20005 [Vibrio breoganii]